MDPFKQSVLEEFGRLFIESMHDRSCWYLEHVFSGAIRGPRPAELADQYLSLDEHGRHVVRLFAMEGVHSAMAELLKFFDENEIGIAFKTNSGQVVNIQAISDGLVGEICTERGWIARFSKYKDGLKPRPDSAAD